MRAEKVAKNGTVKMDNIYIIKNRLNEALHLRDITAADLSRMTGINKSSLSRYLSGESIPRSLAIGKMAEALHVNPAWVLGYDVPMENGTPFVKLEIDKLSPENQQRLFAYYEGLLASQGENNGNT